MIYLRFSEYDGVLRSGTLAYNLSGNTKIVYSLNIQDRDTGKVVLSREGSAPWSDLISGENENLAFDPTKFGMTVGLVSFKMTAYRDNNQAQPTRDGMSSSEEYVPISQFNSYYIDLVKSLGQEPKYAIDCNKMEKGGSFDITVFPTKLASKYVSITKLASELKDETSLIKDKIKILQLELDAAQKSIANYTVQSDDGQSTIDIEEAILNLWDDQGNVNADYLEKANYIYSDLDTNGVLSNAQSTKYRMVTNVSNSINKLMLFIKKEKEARLAIENDKDRESRAEA